MLCYVITDRRRLASTEAVRRATLLEQVGHWAVAGIDYIQLREKDLTPAALGSLAGEMLTVLEARVTPHHLQRPKLLINSRPDVAIAIRADGVHLTSAAGQLTPAQVRQLYSAAGLAEPIISISCHSVSEVIAARNSGASMILFGPVFEKAIFDRGSVSRIAGGRGLALLAEACTAAGRTPVLALGGITAENAEACLQAGAAGLAGIRFYAQSGQRD